MPPGETLFRGGIETGPWPWQRRDVLVCLYIEDGKTRREIAGELGCSPETIDKWLARYGIRKEGEA